MLIVDDLACRRGGLILLQGICFRVGPGEGLQLMGPNGVGKTTLLMTIAGLTPAAEGRVACNEEELVYVGHQNAVSPLLTVEENLDFWSDLYSVPRDREVMEDPGDRVHCAMSGTVLLCWPAATACSRQGMYITAKNLVAGRAGNIAGFSGSADPEGPVDSTS